MTTFEHLRCFLVFIAINKLYFSFNNWVAIAFQLSPNNACRKSTESPLMTSSLSSSGTEISEFELLQRSLYRKELDNARHKSTWLDSMKQLPFDCTGCGNCCKTTGNVYMSPEEVISAASYLNVTTSEFINSYADYKLESASTNIAGSFGHGEVPWILLQNREPQNTEGPPSCIFLDSETNECGIYSVRPIQCSTYPFWSNILASEQNWNREVRRKHVIDADVSSVPPDLPEWTPDNGGCEGMDVIKSIDVDATSTDDGGVAVDMALEQLSLYKHANRRTPRNYRKVPLRNNLT